ncbi:MAG: MBL fold metallo-hydrolase [Bacteroidetes bacterium]|nr:MBL fold metallo-hydrolase [Bacteroidota bacterium]
MITRFDQQAYEVLRFTGYDRWRQNCYVVIHMETKEAIVVDPGGNLHILYQILEETGAQVKYILLTHTHYDHLVAAEELSQKLHLPVTVHKADVRLLKQSPNFALLFDKVKFTSPQQLDIFEGEPVLPFAGGGIRVLHLPGHTPGSACYLIDGFCLIGDLILEKGAGRTDLPGGNEAHLRESLANLTQMDSNLLLFPGHDEPFTVAQLRTFYHPA